MREVPDIAAVEIERLRKQGITVTDNDVVWLSCLGYRVANPNSQTLEASSIYDGVMLSNDMMLKPLTVRASEWLGRFGCVFADIADVFVVAYAMANRDKLKLDEPVKTVVSDVCAWIYSLNVSAEEVKTAVARLLADDTPDNPDVKYMTTDELIGLLVASTGLSAKHWEKQTWAQVGYAYDGMMTYASIISELGSNPETQSSRAALKDFALAIQEIINPKPEGKKNNG